MADQQRRKRISEGAWKEQAMRSALLILSNMLQKNADAEARGEEPVELAIGSYPDIVAATKFVLDAYDKVKADAEAVLESLGAIHKLTNFMPGMPPESIVFYVRFEGEETGVKAPKVTSADELVLEDARKKYVEKQITAAEFAQIVSNITLNKKV